MFGSIYIGMSGLTAYSRGLQQVSNNVSNLNSQGFKSATVTFRDLFGPNGNQAGAPGTQQATGHGVTNGLTLTDMKQGELRQTDRDLDLAVDGEGFLMLLRGDEIAYTRTGSFEVDDDGYVTLSGSEYRLGVLGDDGLPGAVTIDPSRTSAPKATTKITLADNLSSGSATHTISDIKVVDPNGGEHVWKLTFTRDATLPGQWSLAVTDDKSAAIGTQTFRFIGSMVDPANESLVFEDTTNAAEVTIDLSDVTSFSSGTISTLRSASVDGYAPGTLVSLTVNEKGELELAYSNEQKVQLGAVGLAIFGEPQALVQKSGGLFLDPGSARREILTTEDPRAGTVLSRRIEASNVDLSREFGDLILIQRGFQASSQIVSVTNDMIQQLFGIRGQG